ncbi:MAG: hypothetical protein GF416_05090 [Candidatus Altiarchaeales archaeon]|nr:hypothetical protein [Candidatus Altiarchaeales archaeon]MBD3416491.1 hypothetical protein [Candidatus Altiarchaeales archaeon]
MTGLKCPVCGEPSTGVCASCYLREHPLSIRKQGYRLCGCGLKFFKGRWYDNEEEMFKDLVVRSLKAPPGAEVRVARVQHEHAKGKTKLVADVKVSYKGAKAKEVLEWSVVPEHVTCDTCRKLGTGYFEAVLQVRTDGLDLDLDYNKLMKAEKVKGGVDHYLTSLAYAREKVNDLIRDGYLVKESSKLYGKRDGKDVYRHYFSIKSPHFGVGDFLEYGSRLVRVLELGKTVKTLDLSSGKVKSATMNKLLDSKVLATSDGVRRAIVTEVRPDGVQIMDLEDYENHDVKATDGVSQGSEVSYVVLKKKIFLI